MYKNILDVQTKEFNANYRETNRQAPFLSVAEKQRHAYVMMIKNRGLDESDFEKVTWNPMKYSVKFQYKIECAAIYTELFEGGIPRFYIKDENLFDFFKNTTVRPKEVESILKLDLLTKENNYFLCCGVLGKEQAYTIVVQDSVHDFEDYHIVTVMTDTMNYTFCIEQFDSKKSDKTWVFNLAMNFLFYISAFPECVCDGVPNGVKKNQHSKTISLSDKVVSHTTVEHGFVRPHFRSGYFRHLQSDYFVNCKGKVIFIPATMVKGKAKTVISNKEK